MRMTTRSFSSLVAQRNEAQTEAVTLMGFVSFLKVDLKQILGKFFKWLVESFDPYVIYFTLSNGQKFPFIAFDVYVTLDVPFGERKIRESFKRNFVIYLVNYFFNGSKNCYCSKSVLKYVKDVKRIASLDWCHFVLDKLIISQPNNDDGGPSFSPTLALRELDIKAQIPTTTTVADASVSVEKD
ncbi:hypothetical protein Cgig2_011759 [Carnegiea gigantea]|uniref:Uncharacterized protein n=1 Tax=Carnegiea gigantea TaxID=171969 RepID=A0A9Q1JN07_9CARY|nr:hypothetical protein Cgig2_011759 [Carnegiea gigantea]